MQFMLLALFQFLKQRMEVSHQVKFVGQRICEAAKHGPGFAAPRFSDFVRIAEQRNQFVAEG